MGQAYPFDHPSGGRATSRECEPPKYKNTFHLTPLQECMPTSFVVPASATPQADLAWLENAYVDVASSVSTISVSFFFGSAATYGSDPFNLVNTGSPSQLGARLRRRTSPLSGQTSMPVKVCHVMRACHHH